MPTAAPARRVFISYASHDAAVAQKVSSALGEDWIFGIPSGCSRNFRVFNGATPRRLPEYFA